MKTKTLPFERLPYIQSIVKNHINKDSNLLEIYNSSWDIRNLDELANKHPFTQEQRNILCKELSIQYSRLELNNESKILKNIELLKQENTFTITTGQQIHPFLGPLYVLYKIGSAINLAKKLSVDYPKLNFIPIFWMATEDHDFEEIQTIELFGKKYIWKTEHGGAVGNIDCASLEPLLIQMENEIPELTKNTLFQKAKTCYTKGKSLAEATRLYTHHLFENTGLICLDADKKELKNMFKAEIIEDLIHDRIHNKIDKNTSQVQKHIKKAPIRSNRTNFFYLRPNGRNRIDLDNEIFVIEQFGSFSKNEILIDIEENIQNYSPNVSLRPLYQEKILPNIAYIAGPTEYIYWMQLGKAFKLLGLETPMLLHRNSAYLLSGSILKKITKLNLDIEDFFGNDIKSVLESLKKKVLKEYNMDDTNSDLSLKLDNLKDKWFDIDSKMAKSQLNNFKNIKKSINLIHTEYQMSIKNSPLLGSKISTIEKISNSTINGEIQERQTPILQQIINNDKFVSEYLKATDSQCFNGFLLLN